MSSRMGQLEVESREVPGVRSLLGLPLLYKLLVANVVIAATGTLAGTVLTAHLVRQSSALSTAEIVVAFGVVAVGVSALANLVLIRLALSPLKLLERTAAKVGEGDLTARAPESPLADADMQQLTRAFNDTLGRLVSYRRRLRAAATAALQSAEAERERIAHELHDETASHLTALLVQLRVARESEDRASRNLNLDHIRDGLATAIEGIHRIVRALRPVALDEMGLSKALVEHARSVGDTSNVRMDISVESADGLLSREAELALYRIVQEALANAVRHGRPHRVSLELERGAGTVTTTVRDDGNGFTVGEAPRAFDQGMGLLGMQERAANVGGQVKVESTPGSGTVVRVEIPHREVALG